MNYLRNEVRVVPRVAWVISLAVYAVAAIAIGAISWQKTQETNGRMPMWAFALLVTLSPLVFSLYVLLIGYVHGDARRRAMRPVFWTLLAIFVPNAIGIILYFLLRESLHSPCLSCGRPRQPGVAFCPYCGAAAARMCPKCTHAVERTWLNCAHCGAALDPLEPSRYPVNAVVTPEQRH